MFSLILNGQNYEIIFIVFYSERQDFRFVKKMSVLEIPTYVRVRKLHYKKANNPLVKTNI